MEINKIEQCLRQSIAVPEGFDPVRSRHGPEPGPLYRDTGKYLDNLSVSG